MKTTLQTSELKQRHDSEPRAARRARSFPQTDHHYQSCRLSGGCGEPAKFDRSPFFQISNEYFADEAPRSFAVDAAVFSALVLTTILPIVNSVQAVATLLHHVPVL